MKQNFYNLKPINIYKNIIYILFAILIVACGSGSAAVNPSNQWTWMSGQNVVNTSAGIYGTLGSSALANTPGSRISSASWTDQKNNLWLFGGSGYDSTGANGFLNDLWQYNIATGKWTWMGGQSVKNISAGVYGTLGSPSKTNIPGARYLLVDWVDNSGNLWLFGGSGYDSNGNFGYLNDLWQYNPTAGTWTWVDGAKVENSSGIYGTLGVPSPANIPGARNTPISWTDQSGNFWLFSGYGYDNATIPGFLNDLWQYNLTTGNWTWMSGQNTRNGSGIYGTLGTSGSMNIPGARNSSISWIDKKNNLWLFGGLGFDSAGVTGFLNDLWQYNIKTGLWTWMGGQNVKNVTAGVYGTLGIPSAANIPGARYGSISWNDQNGNLWLFGGLGYDITGTFGRLNDLWKYNPSAATWTWVGGQNTINSSGVYGSLNISSAANIPSGRYNSNNWVDGVGNFWLFGGSGYSISGTPLNNDLWRYTP